MNERFDDRQREGTELDQLLEALSQPTRRHIVASLTKHDPRTEGALDPTTLTPDDRRRKQFKLELRHNHLPWLDDAGYVHWDRDANTITRGPKFDEIEPLLTLLRTHQDELPGEWP